MTIRNPEAFARGKSAGFDGVFDWDFLLPAFHQEGKKKQIEPMDWDAVVERHGHFLVFETKDGEVPISMGQKITLENAVITATPHRYHIIILRAKNEAEVNGWDVWFKGNSGQLVREHIEGDGKQLVEYCRRWFKWASDQR